MFVCYWDSLLSQHLVPQVSRGQTLPGRVWPREAMVPPRDLTIFILGTCTFANLTESPVIMSSVITKLSRLKKGLSQDVEDNTDNIQSQDKH